MTISYIQLNDGQDPHPIDAMTVGTKSISEIGELVTSIDSSSTDAQYPSAKCIYDMVYGSPTLPEHDYSKDYLTFEALGSTRFKFTRNSLEYSVDDGSTWVTLPANTNTPNISSGNKIMFKKTNPTINSSYGIGTFSSTGKFNVSGNIMSLLYGDDFDGQISLSGKDYVFYRLFYNCQNLISVSNLILPATTLANRCYYYMFQGCTSLTTAPKLPATTLVQDCYEYMFYGCTSLTTAPELPATTLADSCYSYMFKGCKSLTTAPSVLPATTLADSCYDSMFIDCTSLTTAPELPATTLVSFSYRGMFRGCTSLTTAPELPATTLVNYCYSFMFYGCTSLTTAPALPATTLEYHCYEYMFYGCTSLTTAPELPVTKLAQDCYNSMFYGCTSLTTAPELPATTLATSCYQGMFQGCTSLTTAPVLPATKLEGSCYNSMFYGCTSLTTAPVLPAATLINRCYYRMFYGCSKLNNITCYAKRNIDTSNLNNWVYGVSETGTFTGDPSSSWPTGVSGVPTGWSSNVQQQ